MIHDLIHSARALAKRPAFSLLAILTIALGIGVNTAMFTIVNGVLWRPYPYTQSDRLVRFNEQSPSGRLNNSGVNAADWKARSNVLEDIALYRPFPVLTLRLSGQDQPVAVAYTQPNLFRILRVQPALGRLFGASEDHPGAEPLAVITHAAWERYFAADPAIIGKTVPVVTAGTSSLLIAGVLPVGFDYEGIEFWLPLGRYPMAPDTLRDNHYFAAIGRLNSDVPIEAAQREVTAISTALETEYPQTNKGVRAVVLSMSDYYAGAVKTPLLVLFWAVAFVMLIACGNVVHLVLTRTLSRGREIAVRLAVGASAPRLIRLLLSEGIILAAAGGALGVLSADWLVTLALKAQPGLLPRIHEVGVDLQSAGYAFAAAAFTALLLAIVPVWRVGRVSLLDALQAAGRGSGDARRQRLGWMMITGEIAMASILAAGAGLMIQTLRNLSRVDVGYEPTGVLSLSFNPPSAKEYTDESARALLDRVQEAARGVPGYTSSALAQPFGIGGNGMLGRVIIPGQTNPSTPPLIPVTFVSPEFFETMRIPVRLGRTLSRIQGDIPEAVVNEAFVRRFLRGENPLGRRVIVWDAVDIVGVVGDSRLQGGLTQAQPEVYLPGVNAGWGPTLLVRIQGSMETAASVLPGRIQSAEPGMRVSSARTLVSQEHSRTALQRFTRGLLLAFAALALLLACLGIYGVASFSVAQRTREIGIRMALGATRANVARLVLSQTLAATLVGVVVGLLGAAGLSRFIRTQLYGVTTYDPVLLVGVSATLAVVALLATAAPIHRASRVDPAISLRQE